MADPIKRAVVIGINKYRDPEITTELKGAENDAREVFARLKHFGGFQLDPDRHLLIGERATGDRIREGISDLFWRKDRYDIALFYFSGHGFLDDYNNGYIAPWDHEYQNPVVAGIRMQELREYFLAATNKMQALLILDCCHSGVSAQPAKGAVSMTAPFYDPLKDVQLQGALGEGKFILASSGADDQSREINAAHKIRIFDQKTRQEEKLPDDLVSHDHGAMTYYLLQGMDGGAGGGGDVRIGNLFSYVAAEVQKLNLHYNNPKTFDCLALTYAQGLASQAVLVNASNRSTIDECVRAATLKMNDIRAVKGNALASIPSGLAATQLVYPGSLLEAVVQADRALKLSPEYPDALMLIQAIDKNLSEMQGYVFLWLGLSNNSEYANADSSDEFDQLTGLMSNLSFENLRRLDQGQRNLVQECMLLCLGMGNVARFKGVLNIVKPFTRAAMPAGIGPAGPSAGPGGARL
ncbi:MAG TPA: caspase family protein [Terriglobales bacterium]|nr:caspase family protein [Terriglobales bacterium]